MFLLFFVPHGQPVFMTPLGRLVTIAYAIAGIPLTFLCVRNIGGLLSTIVTAIYRHLFVGMMMRWRLTKARMRRSRRMSLIRDIMNDGARRLSSQLSRHWLVLDHRLMRDHDLRQSLRRIQKERKKWGRRQAEKEASESPAEDEAEDANEAEDGQESEHPELDKDRETETCDVVNHRVHWKDDAGKVRSEDNDNEDNGDNQITKKEKRQKKAQCENFMHEDELQFMDEEEVDPSAQLGDQLPEEGTSGSARKLQRRSSKRASQKSKRGVNADTNEENVEADTSSKLTRKGSSSKRASMKKKKETKEELRRSAFLEEQEKIRQVFFQETKAQQQSTRGSVRGKKNVKQDTAPDDFIAPDEDDVDSGVDGSGRQRRTGLSGLMAPGTVTLPKSTPKPRKVQTDPSASTTEGLSRASPTEDAADSILDVSEEAQLGIADAVCEEVGEDDPLSKPIDTSSVRVPVWVTLLIMTCYILGGAVMFTVWETDWNFLEGSYFCFITLSTIGFGDFVPGTSLDPLAAQEKWIMCCIYLLLGMAMQAMCFHLMQEEVRASFRGLAARCGLMSSAVDVDMGPEVQQQQQQQQQEHNDGDDDGDDDDDDDGGGNIDVDFDHLGGRG
ncbi:hypothetical protein ACOMHN_065654 [Nucella lapillus]